MGLTARWRPENGGGEKRAQCVHNPCPPGPAKAGTRGIVQGTQASQRQAGKLGSACWLLEGRLGEKAHAFAAVGVAQAQLFGVEHEARVGEELRRSRRTDLPKSDDQGPAYGHAAGGCGLFWGKGARGSLRPLLSALSNRSGPLYLSRGRPSGAACWASLRLAANRLCQSWAQAAQRHGRYRLSWSGAFQTEARGGAVHGAWRRRSSHPMCHDPADAREARRGRRLVHGR